MSEKILSQSGRELSPFSVKTRRIKKQIRAVDEWLLKEAVKEADSMGDDHNLTMFKGINTEVKHDDGGFLTIAERDMLNLYLFGHEDGIEIRWSKP